MADTLNELLRSGEPGKALMADPSDPAGISWQTPPTPPAPTWSEVTGKPASYTPGTHTHLIQDVINLQSSLDAKASTVHNHDGSYAPVAHTHDYAPTSHTHTQSDVTNLVSDLADKASSTHNHDAAYEAKNANIQTHISSAHAPSNAQKNSDITKAEIEAKLTGELTSHTHPSVPAAPHTHTKSDITDFTHTHTKSQVTDFAHTHPASELTATGTPSATTYLRGDNTWSTPAGGGNDPRLVTTRKTSDQAMTSNGATGIDGVILTLEANSTYVLNYTLLIGAVSGTSPTILYNFNNSVSITALHLRRRQMTSATAEAISVITAVASNFAAGAAVLNTLHTIEGVIVTGASGGTFNIRGTAGGTNPSIQIKAGSSATAIKTS